MIRMKNLVLKSSLLLNGMLIMLLLVQLSTNKSIKPDKKLKENVKIVFFGDSRVQEGNWDQLLGRNDVINSGFRGFTSSHLRWIVKESVLDYNPEICFIEVGVNDLGAGIPMQRIQLNIKSLMDTLQVNNILPVIQSVIYQENNPNSKRMIDSLNCFIETFCKENGIEYLDINSKLSNSNGLKNEYSKDGTHFNDSGYKVWRNEIIDKLKKIE